MQIINQQTLEQLQAEAESSPRRRAMRNYHPQLDDPLQRMVNCLLRDSYVQPHKHENPDKREMFMVLKGRLVVVEFDNQGAISDHQELNPALGQFGAEIQPRIWHTLIPLSDYVVVFEVKDGPYHPQEDKLFATWAPAEGTKDALAYNQRIIQRLNLH